MRIARTDGPAGPQAGVRIELSIPIEGDVEPRASLAG